MLWNQISKIESPIPPRWVRRSNSGVWISRFTYIKNNHNITKANNIFGCVGWGNLERWKKIVGDNVALPGGCSVNLSGVQWRVRVQFANYLQVRAYATWVAGPFLRFYVTKINWKAISSSSSAFTCYVERLEFQLTNIMGM